MHVREIDIMVRNGVPFDRIEAHIEELTLPADAKSALWLYAWVEIDRPARRQRGARGARGSSPFSLLDARRVLHSRWKVPDRGARDVKYFGSTGNGSPIHPEPTGWGCPASRMARSALTGRCA